MRRATAAESTSGGMLRISIHALHEESDLDTGKCTVLTGISIHALHEESDASSCAHILPTSCISIHALHEESDGLPRRRRPFCAYFNPRSP